MAKQMLRLVFVLGVVALYAGTAEAAKSSMCSSMTNHSADCVGECGACPIMGPAKDAGADKATILKLSPHRWTWVKESNTAQASKKYKAAGKALKTAQKSKDTKAAAAAQAKIDALLKPSAEKYHKKAKEILGKKMYVTYTKKLPDWAKI